MFRIFRDGGGGEISFRFRLIQLGLICLLGSGLHFGWADPAEGIPLVDPCSSPDDPPETCVGSGHQVATMTVFVTTATTGTADGWGCDFNAHIAGSPNGWWGWGALKCESRIDSNEIPARLGLSLILVTPTHEESWHGCGGEGVPPCEAGTPLAHNHEFRCNDCGTEQVAQMRNEYFLDLTGLGQTVTSVAVASNTDGENAPYCTVETPQTVRCFTKPSATREPITPTQTVIANTVSGTVACTFESKVAPSSNGWRADGSTSCQATDTEMLNHMGLSLQFTSPGQSQAWNGCGSYENNGETVTVTACNDPEYSPTPGTYRVTQTANLHCVDCSVTETAHMDNFHTMRLATNITSWSGPPECNRSLDRRWITCRTFPSAARGPSPRPNGIVNITTVSGTVFTCSYASQIQPTDFGWYSEGATSCQSSEPIVHLGVRLKFETPTPPGQNPHEGSNSCGFDSAYPDETDGLPDCEESPSGSGNYQVTHQLWRSCTACLSVQTAEMENRHLFVFPALISEADSTWPAECDYLNATETMHDHLVCQTTTSAPRPVGPPNLPGPPVVLKVVTEGGLYICYIQAAGAGGIAVGTTSCRTDDAEPAHLGISLIFKRQSPYSNIEGWNGCNNCETPPGSGNYLVTHSIAYPEECSFPQEIIPPVCVPAHRHYMAFPHRIIGLMAPPEPLCYLWTPYSVFCGSGGAIPPSEEEGPN